MLPFFAFNLSPPARDSIQILPSEKLVDIPFVTFPTSQRRSVGVARMYSYVLRIRGGADRIKPSATSNAYALRGPPRSGSYALEAIIYKSMPLNVLRVPRPPIVFA